VHRAAAYGNAHRAIKDVYPADGLPEAKADRKEPPGPQALAKARTRAAKERAQH